MDDLTVALLGIVGFVLAIFLIVAQLQLFAIRRILGDILQIARGQAGVTAPGQIATKPAEAVTPPKSNPGATAVVVLFLLLVVGMVMWVFITTPSK